MIGRLKGKIIEKEAPQILLDVAGVGYEVSVPMTTLYRLPDLNQDVTLYTHFSVSENAQQLFGFADKKDRELFRLLIKASGVGPKMAIGIMSLDSSDFVYHVTNGNVGALTKIPGVGKKTAERIIIETKDKLKAWAGTATAPLLATDTGKTPNSAISQHSVISEAESALVALGYKPGEASRAISAIPITDDTSSAQLIRLALKNMLPG
ncbi:MAG: Holliday junction branch migration protein RuvA [Alteromonadaceae bacterium]|nr:MAG: Holliday junction branch migration protein RuvA [Alteromonadaceae bacterium]